MYFRVLQHNATTRRALFELIGEACASERVHKDLGAKITSEIGDTWLIAQDGGEVRGFCRLNPTKKAIRLLAFYAYGDADLEDRMREAAVAQAKILGGESINAVDYLEKQAAFAAQGWTFKSGRGVSFGLFERDLTTVAVTAAQAIIDTFGDAPPPANNVDVATPAAAIQLLRQILATSAADPIEERVARYNEIVKLAAEHVNLPHPALAPQLVAVDRVRGNDYNPNKVAPPEMRLLQLSITKDGVTMPVVVADDADSTDLIVVDGFHRTTIAKRDTAIRASLQGYLPVVRLNKPIEERISSTVRHNIARGTHQVELTAKLVTALKTHNWSNTRIGLELGMDPDEVLRLKQITGIAEAFADKDFSQAWK